MKIVAGIDVSKEVFDVFFSGREKEFQNCAAGHLAAAKWCTGAELVVMEATGTYHMALACLLHAEGFNVSVVNPARSCWHAKSMGCRNKTDRVDARVLADFGQSRDLALFVPPRESERAMRRLTRLRDDLVAQRVQGRTRMHDPGLTEFERAMWASQEAFLSGQISQAECEIRGVVASDGVLKLDFARLMDIPGFGAVTCWTTLAEMGDPRRFESAKQVAAFAGVCPCLRRSGTSLTGSGRLSRQGSGTLRKALYMAAVAAVRRPNPFQAFYLCLLNRGKSKKTALVAVMHKLIRAAYGVLKGGCPFDPEKTKTSN